MSPWMPVTAWKTPRSGVEEKRAPSVDGVGSSVTSKRRCSQPRREDAIAAADPALPDQENSHR